MALLFNCAASKSKMGKIIVSSNALADTLREYTVTELRVDHLSINGRGEGTLSMLHDKHVIGYAPCMCYGAFHFKFKDVSESERFAASVMNMPDQPITIEDGAQLLVTHISVFR